MENDLKFQPLGIGSLPHENPDDAMEVVFRNFSQVPFFPQLANVSQNEDMMLQFLEGLPSYSLNKSENFVLDSESDEFLSELEEFFGNYEEIIADINSPLLNKYAISEKSSSTFNKFTEFIKNNKPSFAKGQITGAFTLCTTMRDKAGRAVIFDETLTDIVVKLLILKVLWQIKKMKDANPDITPIIFMDEPSVSQIGSSAYLTISEQNVISKINEISQVIKSHGGLSAIHCCGKCDWRIPIKSDVDIINFDAYTYCENFAAYHSEIAKFLNNGGKIAWGLIPTMDGNVLKELKTEDLVNKYKNSVNYLTTNGINEKLILENSLITSSCGAGGLSIKDAELAMNMVREVAQSLKRED